jgi:hypothetical protein
MEDPKKTEEAKQSLIVTAKKWGGILLPIFLVALPMTRVQLT